MPSKTAARLRFALDGPGVNKTYETASVALSAAITLAEKYGNETGEDCTFYVRDFDNSIVGSVIREKGETFIWRAEFIGSGRVA